MKVHYNYSNYLGGKKTKKKKKQKDEGSIKDIAIRMVPYMTPMMAEHCIGQVGLDLNENFYDLYEENPENTANKIIEAALLCKDMVEALEHMETVPGYILYEKVEEVIEEVATDKTSDSVPKEDEKDTDQSKDQESQKLTYAFAKFINLGSNL